MLDDLAAHRLQSDARHAEAYVRSRAERGYGPQRIGLELKQRGTGADLIQQALHNVDRDWRLVAADADRKKFGRAPAADPALLARRRRFLEYRGFTTDQIRSVLRGAGDDEFELGG